MELKGVVGNEFRNAKITLRSESEDFPPVPEHRPALRMTALQLRDYLAEKYSHYWLKKLQARNLNHKPQAKTVDEAINDILESCHCATKGLMHLGTALMLPEIISEGLHAALEEYEKRRTPNDLRKAQAGIGKLGIICSDSWFAKHLQRWAKIPISENFMKDSAPALEKCPKPSWYNITAGKLDGAAVVLLFLLADLGYLRERSGQPTDQIQSSANMNLLTSASFKQL